MSAADVSAAEQYARDKEQQREADDQCCHRRETKYAIDKALDKAGDPVIAAQAKNRSRMPCYYVNDL